MKESNKNMAGKFDWRCQECQNFGCTTVYLVFTLFNHGYLHLALAKCVLPERQGPRTKASPLLSTLPLPPSNIIFNKEAPSRILGHCENQNLFSLFSLFYRYEIQAVRKSLLSGELENSTMPWKTTEKIFRWMDEIRRQIGVVYKEDM